MKYGRTFNEKRRSLPHQIFAGRHRLRPLPILTAIRACVLMVNSNDMFYGVADIKDRLERTDLSKTYLGRKSKSGIVTNTPRTQILTDY